MEEEEKTEVYSLYKELGRIKSDEEKIEKLKKDKWFFSLFSS
jgi:hypothetical protein